jgi:hypothetical protein
MSDKLRFIVFNVAAPRDWLTIIKLAPDIGGLSPEEVIPNCRRTATRRRGSLFLLCPFPGAERPMFRNGQGGCDQVPSAVDFEIYLCI